MGLVLFILFIIVVAVWWFINWLFSYHVKVNAAVNHYGENNVTVKVGRRANEWHECLLIGSAGIEKDSFEQDLDALKKKGATKCRVLNKKRRWRKKQSSSV